MEAEDGKLVRFLLSTIQIATVLGIQIQSTSENWTPGNIQ
jgi:hypothetical protein